MAFAQVNKWRETAPSDGGRYELDANKEWYCVWCRKAATKGEGGHLESLVHLKRLGNNGVELSDAQLRSIGWLAEPDQLQIADRGSAAAASGAPGLASGSTPGLDGMVGPHNELDHLRRQIAYQRGEIMRMKVQIDEQIEKLALMMGIFDEQEQRIEDIDRRWQ